MQDLSSHAIGVDAVHLELGRFVAAYSGLMSSLEEGTIAFVSPAWPIFANHMLLRSALADRTAKGTTDAFFSVVRTAWAGRIDEAGDKILKKLRNEIEAVTPVRNRLLHDVWMTSQTGGSDEIGTVTMRFRASSTDGGSFESNDRTVFELSELVLTCKRLTGCVSGIAFYSRTPEKGLASDPDLSARLGLKDGKVVRLP